MPEHRRVHPALPVKVSGAHPDTAIRALADRQHGVVARRQLLAAGLTLSMIEERIARGALASLHRGVYAVGHRQLKREGHWLAAVLAVGPEAVLSHRHAAALHGIRPANTTAVDVSTPARVADRRGIEVHGRRALRPDDTTAIDGIPVTSLSMTLVDLAGTIPPDHLAKALSEAERLERIDVNGIEEAMARTRGRHGRGHAALRRALDDMRGHGTTLTRSELEARFLALLDAHRIPRPRMNFFIQGMEVDAVWPTHRLAVELDGWAYHRHRRAFEHDRVKANALNAAGYAVLRFTHDQVVRRPAYVAATVARMLPGASAA